MPTRDCRPRSRPCRRAGAAPGPGRSRPGLRAGIGLAGCAAAVVLGFRAGAGEAPGPPTPADPAAALAARLAGLGFRIREDRAFPAAAEAMLQTADPGARVGCPFEIAAREAEQEGRDPDPGLDLEFRDGQAVVRHVEPGSPAAEAGIEAGDLLESLDGRYASGRDPADILSALHSRDGEPVSLAIWRPGEALARETTLLPRFTLPPPIGLAERWPRGIGYARIRAVREGLCDALAGLAAEWGAAPEVGVILDLRDAGGDSAREAARLAYALGAAAAPRTEPPLDPEDGAFGEADAPAPRFDVPVVLVIDPLTRGAAELLAAGVRGSGRTLVLGGPTFGDPMLRMAAEIETGLWAWSAARILRAPDGRTYEAGVPVEPDIRVEPGSIPAVRPAPDPGVRDRRRILDIEEADRLLEDRTGADAALRRAADILLALRALSAREAPGSE